MSEPQTLAIPVKLDAFVFNAAVCGGSDPNVDQNRTKAKIAPITQPNYTFLRFERTMVQNDILNFTDLHKTGPAAFNPRFTDLGTGTPRANRQGVYIHWIVPRPYRSGSTISQNPQVAERSREVKGMKPRAVQDAPPVSEGDTAAPDFNPAPPRWLVIRKVEKSEPANVLPEVDAWVVESDRRQVLDDIPTTSDVDLQVDFSPYIHGAADLDQTALEQQAEVFIGYKASANDWEETIDNPKIPPDEQPLRVELNLVNSSNQLFPDYQPHNSNVFSLVDTLQYGTDADGNALVVDTATVSYYVLGWHSSNDQDLFGDLDPTGSVTRADRLKALKMVLNEADPTTQAGVRDWLASKDPTRVICHGAMYNVLWDSGNKPPIVPADIYHEKLNSDMPVSIGTTPMDALLTYVKSHASPNSQSADDIKEVEQDLLRIQKLLHARDDGVDAQDEADDIVYNWNYANTAGGSHYFLAGSDGGKGDKGRPTAPDAANIAKLAVVNSQQRYLDVLSRQLQLLRWEMFALWWEYMTDLTAPDPQKTKLIVQQKSQQISNLLAQMTLALANVQKSKSTIPDGLAQMGVLPSFYQARDPTMLVAGIESGWPYDYLNDLNTRVDTQLVVASDAPPMDQSWTTFCANILPKLPPALKNVAQGLVAEFLSLNPNLETPPTPEPGSLDPLYHDKDKTHFLPDGTAPWRDRWEESQAWFPLFLEWEAEYTQIPYTPDDSLWTLGPRSAWLSDPKKLRYGIAPGVELADLKLADRRTVSGRVLILPQPNFSLQTIVNQILDNTPPQQLNSLLTPEQQQELRDHLNELAFLSSPLSGFTDHLLTRVQGNHVKPTVRVPNTDTDPQPFTAAIAVGQDVGFGRTELTMMGIETDLTPYGTLVSYLDSNFCPFKPATHGQFRFTALNIIDKFGQAIHAIDPTPTPDDVGPPPLYPCISEYYTPQPSNQDPSKANTVVPDGPNLCQYVQLPPSINQPARLNSTFIDYFAADTVAGTPAGWRPLTEWEDHVWGWVVPNYADSGIQLFLPDGTFFREIRLGGPSGATESGTWLPFQPPPPTTTQDPNVYQLQLFADQLADKDYLHSFVAMLNMSLGTTAPPPTAYSEFLSSLIGKPLALVKAGYSLELATAPLSNTSTIDGPPPDPQVPLLPSPTDPKNHYSFAMQLGDISRVYDGLIAYFLPSQNPVPGDTLDLGTLYTHFVPPSEPDNPPTPNLTQIATSNYPVISPFWLDPMSDDIVNAKDPAAAYTQEWNAQLATVGAVVGALVDPFVPLHAYTGILPTDALQLPAWTWQTALARMTAFFHMGPLLVTTDVPGFNQGNALAQDYDLANDATVLAGSGVGVPSLQAGKWAWLQAYSVVAGGKEGGGESAQTEYMALDMAAVDERPRFEPAPYTAVEGYMQLREAIGQAVAPQQEPSLA